MEASFSNWHKKTLLEISEDMIAERHQELWQQHGKAYANRTMRCLRTMYNFFSTHYRDASGKSLVPEKSGQVTGAHLITLSAAQTGDITADR